MAVNDFANRLNELILLQKKSMTINNGTVQWEHDTEYEMSAKGQLQI